MAVRSRSRSAPRRAIAGRGGIVAMMAETPTAAAQLSGPFDWDDLGQYKAAGRFLDGYPDDVRTFYSPVDNVHGVLTALLASTQKSIVVNMFGYDDSDLNGIILEKLEDEDVYVQMSLDKTQARVSTSASCSPPGNTNWPVTRSLSDTPAKARSRT
jgi:hypothetical protein